MTAVELPRTMDRVSAVLRGAWTSPTAPIWAAGVLIRLLVMPFTAHLDLYHIYSRAADAAYHGQWFDWGSQLLIQMVHNVWLWLIKPLLPGAEPIWSRTAAILGLGAQPGEFRVNFMNYALLPRALFLMKLPYLAADLATGYVLTRIVTPERRRRVLALWLLNPLVIYTSVIYGRHDSIAVLAVVVSIWAASRGRRYAGLGLLGLGAVTRFFPFVLAPFYVISYRRSRRELAVLAGGLIAIWAVMEIAVLALTGSSPTLTLLNRYQHVDYLTDLVLPFRFNDQLFIFPAAYALLTVWFFDRDPVGSCDYAAAGSAVFLVMFALVFFQPAYAIWLVPLLALTIDRDSRLIGYHILQILLLGLFAMHWGTEMTTDLFLPLDPRGIGALPDPQTIVGAQIPADWFLGLVRSLFTALSLWMAYRILRTRFGPRAARPDPAVALVEVVNEVR